VTVVQRLVRNLRADTAQGMVEYLLLLNLVILLVLTLFFAVKHFFAGV